MQALVDAVRAGGPSPIPFAEMVEVTRLCLDLADHDNAKIVAPSRAET
jgi:hypothetical protein